jgi:hypothetical protein
MANCSAIVAEECHPINDNFKMVSAAVILLIFKLRPWLVGITPHPLLLLAMEPLVT